MRSGRMGKTSMIRKCGPFLACLLLAQAGPLFACKVPVFEYALKHWSPGVFRATLMQDGPLTDKQQAAVDAIRSAGNPPPFNLDLVILDLSSDPGAAKAQAIQDRPDMTFPWLAVQYPNPLERVTVGKGNWPPGMGQEAPPGMAPPRPPGMAPPMPPGMAPRPPRADAKPDKPKRAPSAWRPTSGDGRPMWAGPLREETLRLLLDSPARREAARCILAGGSIVWLLLESGDASQDGPALTLLQQELHRLKAEIEMKDAEQEKKEAERSAAPPGMPQPPPGEQEQEEEKINYTFPILRVSRQDPAEELFVAQLLGAGPGLADHKGPIVFPIFGRGRALDGIAGPMLNGQGITAAAEFLCGDCSCMIKEQNPGTDLLIAADWSSANDFTPPKGVADALGGLPSLALLPPMPPPAPTPAPVAAPVPAKPATPPPPARKAATIDPMARNTFVAACVLLVLAVVGSVIVLGRKRGR